MFSSFPLTISFGDNPESMDSVLDIVRDVGAFVEFEVVATGEDLYRREIKEGVLPESFESVNRTKLFLKAPTKTPNSDGYISVMDAFLQKFDVSTKLEYFVGENTPGVGLVVETEENRINVEDAVNIFAASQKLGGQSFAYAIDELNFVMDQAGKEHKSISSKFLSVSDISQQIANFDVIFANEEQAQQIKKAIKPKYGCNIYLGNGYAFFEPHDDYNKDGKGLLLAAALVLKYSGQPEAAWDVYKSMK